MLAEPPLEQHQVDPVARYMFLRDRIPAAMLDRHPRLGSDRLEAHLDLGRLIGAKTWQAPAERQSLSGQPATDAPDLPLGAVGEARDQPPLGTRGVESQRAVALSRHFEQRMAFPP